MVQITTNFHRYAARFCFLYRLLRCGYVDSHFLLFNVAPACKRPMSIAARGMRNAFASRNAFKCIDWYARADAAANLHMKQYHNGWLPMKCRFVCFDQRPRNINTRKSLKIVNVKTFQLWLRTNAFIHLLILIGLMLCNNTHRLCYCR